MILSYVHAHVPEIPSPLTWRKSHTLAMASEITGSVSLLTTCLKCFLSCPQASMQLDYYFVCSPVAVPGYFLTQWPTASQEPYCEDSASLPNVRPVMAMRHFRIPPTPNCQHVLMLLVSLIFWLPILTFSELKFQEDCGIFLFWIVLPPWVRTVNIT